MQFPDYSIFPIVFKILGELQEVTSTMNLVEQNTFIDLTVWCTTHLIEQYQRKTNNFQNVTSKFQKLIYFCKKIWKEVTRKLLHRQSPRPRIDSFYATPSEIYFFYFFGLATFWNGKPRRLPTVMDESIHVEEPLIIQLATWARLTINDDGNQNPISNPTEKSDQNPTDFNTSQEFVKISNVRLQTELGTLAERFRGYRFIQERLIVKLQCMFTFQIQ